MLIHLTLNVSGRAFLDFLLNTFVHTSMNTLLNNLSCKRIIIFLLSSEYVLLSFTKNSTILINIDFILCAWHVHLLILDYDTRSTLKISFKKKSSGYHFYLFLCKNLHLTDVRSLTCTNYLIPTSNLIKMVALHGTTLTTMGWCLFLAVVKSSYLNVSIQLIRLVNCVIN